MLNSVSIFSLHYQITNVRKSIMERFSDRTVIAAGIDAPLFWIASGDRQVDKLVRKRIKSHQSTVMSPNSLCGACIIQGVMIAILLRRNWPTLPLTEAHPKAFLYAENSDLSKSDLERTEISNLQDHLDCKNSLQGQNNNEHVRDAAIAALFAWAMVHKNQDWENLFPGEIGAYSPIEQPLGYWFPKDDESNLKRS